VIVIEAISREFRVALPLELLYADDLAVIAETEEELIKRLNEWKDKVESKGMRVNMNIVLEVLMAFFRAFNCRILYGLYLPTYCYLEFHHPLTLSFQA